LGNDHEKILLVDDNEDMLETLKHLFTLYNFDVVLASNGKEAIDVANKESPHLIVLDALMPVMNGFEACKYLKNGKKTKDIPVIFLSANYTEDSHRIMGLELGADDYILKPFNAKELVTKVKSILRRKAFIEKLRTDNKGLLKEQSDYSKKLEALRKRTQQLQKEVVTDGLTGVYNGHYFLPRLREEFLRSKRYNNQLSIVLIEVDHFEKINKEYGRQAGEYILMKVVNVILNNTRNSDVIFRVEGNRFGIILPNTDETGAYQEAERIREAIDDTKVINKEFFDLSIAPHKRKQGIKNVTASVGVSSLVNGVEKVDAFLEAAEKALKKAREEGRNLTIKHSELASGIG
jgi:diguanylate cyclase (GGDEF)-like protein